MRWEREGQGGDLRSAQDAGTIPYASTLNTINSSRNVGALIVAMSANYSFRYCFVASIQTPPWQKSVGASDAKMSLSWRPDPACVRWPNRQLALVS
jgi:hypothetical protein